MKRTLLAAACAALALSHVGPALAQAGSTTQAAPPVAGPRPGEKIVEDVVAWVNDDVVLLTEIAEYEETAVAQILQENKGAMTPEVSRKIGEIKANGLVQMISSKVLLQAAEQLVDMADVRRDVVKRFKERQKIKTDEELDRQLIEWGMTRSELEDRLLEGSLPDIVIDMQVRQQISVSEQEAREFYQQNTDKLTEPAQVTFRELVLTAQTPEQRAGRRAEAERLVAEARGGADFVQLLKQHSDAASKNVDGKIGPVVAADLLRAIADEVLRMPVGSVSDPIETPQGWIIVKLEARQDAKTPAFEEVRRDAEDAVRERKFQAALDTYLHGLWRSATIEVREPYLDRIPETWRPLVKARS